MKLFNVFMELRYDASHEGEINQDYTSLVWAKSGEDAMEFLDNDMGNKMSGSKSTGFVEVDSTIGKSKRKTQFYSPTVN